MHCRSIFLFFSSRQSPLAVRSVGNLDLFLMESVGCEIGIIFPVELLQCVEPEMSSLLAYCMHSLLLPLLIPTPPESLPLNSE